MLSTYVNLADNNVSPTTLLFTDLSHLSFLENVLLFYFLNFKISSINFYLSVRESITVYIDTLTSHEKFILHSLQTIEARIRQWP